MRKDKHLWSKIHTIYQRIQYNSPAKLGNTLNKKRRLKQFISCTYAHVHYTQRSLTSCMMLHDNGGSKKIIKWVITQIQNSPADVGKSRQGIKSQLCSHDTLIRKTHPLMECVDINKGYLWSCIHTCNKSFSKLTSYSWQWSEWSSTEKERKHWSHPRHIIKLTSYWYIMG